MTKYIRWSIYTMTADVKDVQDIKCGCTLTPEEPQITYYDDEVQARKAFSGLVSDVSRQTVTEYTLFEEVWIRDESDPDDEGDFYDGIDCVISPMPWIITFDHADYKRVDDEWVVVSIYGRTADEFAALVEAAGHDTDEEPELYTGEWQLDLPGLITAKETSHGFEIEG